MDYDSMPWRVYPALIVEHPWKGDGVACLLVLMAECATKIVRERHFNQRNSAAFWVYLHEFELMRADIEADWKRREVWREQNNDVAVITTEMIQLAEEWKRATSLERAQ